MDKILKDQIRELNEIFVTLVRLNDDEEIVRLVEALDELIMSFGLTQAK